MRKEYDLSKGRRGAVVPIPPGKTRITIRVDDDILDWFRDRVNEAGGGNYQTLINQALRSAMEAPRESAERAVRRAVREEIARYEARRPSRGPRS
jgi:Arc/MetJ family transcription regulator